MKLLDAIKLISAIENPVNAIHTLLNKGCPKSILKIVINDCYDHVTNKDIEATVKQWESENSNQSRTGGGFAADFYDWLAEESRTEEEAHDYIMAGSRNVQNHLTHYLNIWALAETVRSGKKVYRTIAKSNAKSAKKEPEMEPEVEPELDERAEAIKAAWKVLHEFNKNPAKTKRGYNKVHPDKVSHLGDEELTKAYTQVYQTAPKR